MFVRNRSGQAVFFSMVSAISGNAVTGVAASISGRVTLDNGSMAVVAGAIDEPGGGQYRLLTFAADTNGNVLGFYFTASGCVPTSYTVITQQNVSGQLFDASGLNAVVPIASISGTNAVVPIATLSGVQIISGATVTVPIASISGNWGASGTNAVVPIASISGTNAVVPIATLSGVQPISGATVTVPIASISGVQIVSGATVTVPIASISGNWGASGTNAVVPIASISGTNAVVPIATISGTWPASGATVVVPPATISGVVANSGLFVNVPVATLSGIQPISGTTVIVPVATLSGVNAISTVYSGNLSGQQITLTSGQSYIASGHWPASGAFTVASVTVASGSIYLASGSIFRETFASGAIGASGGISLAWGDSGAVTVGRNLASGTFATVPIASISGTNAVVPPATLSGVVANSGLNVIVPVATLSGITIASGNQVAIVSGTFVTPWSGMVYLASGTGSTAVVDSGSIAQIASTLLTVDVSGSIEANAAKQSLATVVLKQTSRFDAASGKTYLCDGTTVKMTQQVTTGSGLRPVKELGVGQ